MGLNGKKSLRLINGFGLFVIIMIAQQYFNRDKQSKSSEYKSPPPQTHLNEEDINNRIPSSLQKKEILPVQQQPLSSPKNLNENMKKEDDNGTFSPKIYLKTPKRSTRLSQFEKFKFLKRENLILPKETTPPELEGWSILPELSTVSKNDKKNDKDILSFNTLTFKSGKLNLSTLNNFTGPIAIISPDTQKIAIISGRLSVLHKEEIDREQFAIDHSLQLIASPEHSKSASYIALSQPSLLQLKNELSHDPRVQIVEIEILSEGLKK